ncbi:hypothetical protein RB195_013629 [Necator americanus]|uniref:Uncharacterized protein n=1 Tax=Necator americanus TaxID=51031 RepID=A0ABR1DWG4_NECAM
MSTTLTESCRLACRKLARTALLMSSEIKGRKGSLLLVLACGTAAQLHGSDLNERPLLGTHWTEQCGAHRRQCHDNTPFNIAVTILARESDVLARKTLEAFYITAKSPIMNRKEECIAVTNELAPYQDLCGGATLTTGGPLTSRFRGYQGSEEGDDAETLARIKINNNLGSA